MCLLDLASDINGGAQFEVLNDCVLGWELWCWGESCGVGVRVVVLG